MWDVEKAAENKLPQDGFVGTGAGTAPSPHSLWEPSSLHAETPGQPLSRSLTVPWSPAGHTGFHFHIDSLCLEGVTDTPDPQRDCNHFNSSLNNHLAIIVPPMCVFLGSTSATLQNRAQSQRFPTAFKTSGTSKPL